VRLAETGSGFRAPKKSLRVARGRAHREPASRPRERRFERGPALAKARPVNVGLYRSAVAMSAQQRRLDGISANLANVGTVGFKRGVTASHEVEVERPRGKVRGVTTLAEVDFAQGNLTRTGREHDVALFGDGFFAVDGPDGEAYTRDGSFHVTEGGVLVSEEGLPVAWDQLSGSIDPVGMPLVIDQAGNVRQGIQDIGRLRVVAFDDPSVLSKDARGFWSAPRGVRPLPSDAQVHQYSLEESNANAMEEMVDMITVQRSFETVARVFEAIDQTYERLTRPF
jgi:flagellar basal-body rod protein FlgF